MSLFLRRAAVIGFANFIGEISSIKKFHYTRSSSHKENMIEEHSQVLSSISKDLLKI